MESKRMKQLQEKAASVGLNDAEANELGRLFAEAEGKRYSNADLERRAKQTAAAVMNGRVISKRRWPMRLSGRPTARLRTLEIGETGLANEEAPRTDGKSPVGKGPRSEAA